MSAEKKVVNKKFGFADAESMQVFIEEQHRKGFQICDVKGDNYLFEPCPKGEFAYYVTFRDQSKERNSEYIKRFEKAGWKLVFSKNREWYYFCKPKSALVSQVQRKNEVDKKAVKRSIRSTMVCYFVFATVFTIGINIADLSSLSRPETFERIINIAYVIFLVVFCYATVKTVGRIKRKRSE